jgi:hypothetical protein
MTVLGLMNKLEATEYLERFNRAYVKESPSESTDEYEVSPRLTAILHQKKV